MKLDRKKTFNAVFFTFFSVGGDCDGPRWRVRTKISFFSRCRFSFSARCEIIGSRKKTRPNTLFGLFRFQAAAAGGQFQNLSVLKLLLEWKFHFFKYRPSFIEQRQVSMTVPSARFLQCYIHFSLDCCNS